MPGTASVRRTAKLGVWGNPVEKTANYTVKVSDNNGIITMTSADKTVTLPSSPPQNFRITIVQNTASSGTGMVIDVPAAHTLVYNGKTAGQDLTNTGATDVIGDMVTLRFYQNKWYIEAMQGIWA